VDIRLDDRVALVTGSTAGVGLGIAAALADAGAFVVVTGRDAARGAAVVETLSAAGGRAAFVGADLSGGRDAIRTLVSDASRAAGAPIDILVNNAAMLLDPTPTSDVDEMTITSAFATSVGAPFLLTGLVAPAMAGRGGGAIVNVGSINGMVGMATSALYSSTKAALHSLTKSWAAEYAGTGVRVNTVAPGPTATAANVARAEMLAPLLARIPSGRMSTTDEVGAAVVFLAGDFALNIHGATLTVDGGFTVL
jgi:NAD(P)-dependent dehydrogenase (short-subunit alcohol dehydrogenase family)